MECAFVCGCSGLITVCFVHYWVLVPAQGMEEGGRTGSCPECPKGWQQWVVLPRGPAPTLADGRQALDFLQMDTESRPWKAPSLQLVGTVALRGDMLLTLKSPWQDMCMVALGVLVTSANPVSLPKVSWLRPGQGQDPQAHLPSELTLGRYGLDSVLPPASSHHPLHSDRMVRDIEASRVGYIVNYSVNYRVGKVVRYRYTGGKGTHGKTQR